MLRATIEIIQEKSPYQKDKDNLVILPVGLLILKWLEYYYPIIEKNLPQRNGDNLDSFTLSFRALFKKVTNFYSEKGGLSVFYSELVRGNLPNEIEDTVFQLCKKLRDTIKDQPMRYIGKSVYGEEYQIFKRLKTNTQLRQPDKMDVNFLIENFSEFSIPSDYYSVMELMGSFITGMHSILINWAEFTVDKDKSLSMNQVLETMLKSPQEARNVLLSQNIFTALKQDKGELECVWSGNRITTDLNIDHVLPFSVWRNNDLWNLLPAKAIVNNRKRDKIPSLQLLEKRKERIISYWQFIWKTEQAGFEKELNVNLITRQDFSQSNWENPAFQSLKEKCRYLIETRGFEEFHLP
ncbi:HNH endonuclease domain-containing protein [Gracilimonas sp.]|uniref:HNH endonuclease domain-containing protein n=1 Tax=Gracilimonas sp. TaxID=1974203 RepID=UPI0028728D81|nr:HNH endonuclease domain-containing protein [Gracilimonas sp.]